MKLMTYEEYTRLKNIKVPYIFELKKGKKKLLYFGSEHSNNPKHKQFAIFKKKFLAFKPDVVLLEGGAENNTDNSEKEAISRSEMSFINYLALQQRIPRLTAEPSMKKILSSLEKKYSKDQLFAYYILEVFPQYIRYNKPRGYIKKWICWFKDLTRWKHFDYSLLHLESIHKSVFGRRIDKLNERAYTFPPHPVENLSIFNHLSKDETLIRDKATVKHISNALKKYNRILIIMGYSHAIIQEPALRELFHAL